MILPKAAASEKRVLGLAYYVYLELFNGLTEYR